MRRFIAGYLVVAVFLLTSACAPTQMQDEKMLNSETEFRAEVNKYHIDVGRKSRVIRLNQDLFLVTYLYAGDDREVIGKVLEYMRSAGCRIVDLDSLHKDGMIMKVRVDTIPTCLPALDS